MVSHRSPNVCTVSGCERETSSGRTCDRHLAEHAASRSQPRADPEADELAAAKALLIEAEKERDYQADAGNVAISEIARLRIALSDVEAERDSLKAEVAEFYEVDGLIGSVVCALIFDRERENEDWKKHSVCSFCGLKTKRGAEMRAHAESCAKHPMAALRVEVDRLRGLVATGCRAGEDVDECPWCLYDHSAERNARGGSRVHALNCPAFTADGSVR